MLKCPLCPEKLAFETVKRYSSQFEEFDRRATLQVLCGMEDFRLCRRKGCEWGQIHEGGEEYPIWCCGGCGGRMCFRHEVEWHEGMNCEEYEETVGKRRLEELELSERFLEKVCIFFLNS